MEKQIMENANKAFETAKLTSYWLYLAGIPEAVEYAKLINLDSMDPEAIPHSQDMCFLNPIIHEIRYKSINYYIRQSGCKNVLDIACGYSPRGMQLAREGYSYVGADLPVVAEELQPVAAKLGLDNLKYVGADATNFDSLKSAIESLEGPVAVVVEGLGMYLNKSEAAVVRGNIVRLLQEREGSVYITCDPGNGYLFYEVINATRPPRLIMPTFGMLFEMYNWASNGGITNETEKRPIEEDARMFEESGLEVDMCPLLPEDTDLLIYKTVDSEIAEKLKSSLSKKLIFVSKAGACAGNPADAGEGQEFDLSADVEDGRLCIKLKGRLDTITVPRLLEAVDQKLEGCSGVVIDLAGVSFVSSSGLRAFYLIGQRLGQDQKLEISGASEEISSLLANDGIIKHIS